MSHDATPRFPSDATRVRLRTTAPEQWRILTLETAAPLGGACLSRGPDIVASRAFPEPQSHARHAVAFIDELMREAGWKAGDIDVVLVNRGPGSHTGVRIGLATARLFAWQTGCAARGVISLDALAASVAPAPESAMPGDATIVALLPCRRGELYVRRYAALPFPRPLDNARTLPVDAVRAMLTEHAIVVGAGATREAESLGLAPDDPRMADVRADDRTVDGSKDDGWPRLDSTLAVGFTDAVRQSFDAAAWAATLEALYLHRPLAKTVAERAAESREDA